MKDILHRYLFWLFACFFSLNLKAEVVRFSHIDVDDGLPYNSIRTIEQDSKGFMWFGSELGLSKFDGYQLKNYVANIDTEHSLANSYVRSLSIVNNEELWIGGEGGLSRYNRSDDSFTVFSHDENNRNSLCAGHVIRW